MRECKLCQGTLYTLGTLGNLVHYKCRGCGMEFNAPVVDEPVHIDKYEYDDPMEEMREHPSLTAWERNND